MQFHFNEIYEQVLLSDAFEIDITGGRGRGGSHFCTDYFLYKIITSKHFRGYFMRLIHSDIKNSLYQDFKDRIEEKEEELDIKLLDKFHFNENELSIKYKPNGNMIISKGFRKSSNTRTAKMKSIAGATDIVIEEFEEVEEQDYRKLKDSLRTTKAQPRILRIWNPPHKDHWILTTYYNLIPNKEAEQLQKNIGINDPEVYYDYKPKGVKNHLCVYSTYLDNYDNINTTTSEMWEAYKEEERTIDHYLTDIKGLVSSGAKGVIFKRWKEFTNIPEDSYFYKVFGIDWGGTDPNTFMELNFDKKKRRVYIYEHLYQPDIRNAQFIELVKFKNPENNEVVYDSARRDKYYEFADHGINMIKADKSKINDDFRKDVIDMLKEYDIFIHVSATNTQKEFREWKWAINAVTKEPLNKPEDKNNHTIDATLYATRYYHVNFGHYYNNKSS